MKKLQRRLASILAFLMLLPLFPTAVSAEEVISAEGNTLSVMSLLPQEHRHFDVEISDMFAEELRNVSFQEIFQRAVPTDGEAVPTLLDTDKIRWTRDGDDQYSEALKPTDTIDLLSFCDTDTYTIYLTIRVGYAEQLAGSDTVYHVAITYNAISVWSAIEYSVATGEGRREIPVMDVQNSFNPPVRYYHLSLSSELYRQFDPAYIGMKFSAAWLEKLKSAGVDSSALSAEVYKGHPETLTNADKITDAMWDADLSTGGYLWERTDEGRVPTYTVALMRRGKAEPVEIIRIEMYLESADASISHAAAIYDNSASRKAASREALDYQRDIYVYTLYPQYAGAQPDEAFYFGLKFVDAKNPEAKMEDVIDAAYVGDQIYETEQAAKAAGLIDMKEALFAKPDTDQDAFQISADDVNRTFYFSVFDTQGNRIPVAGMKMRMTPPAVTVHVEGLYRDSKESVCDELYSSPWASMREDGTGSCSLRMGSSNDPADGKYYLHASYKCGDKKPPRAVYEGKYETEAAARAEQKPDIQGQLFAPADAAYSQYYPVEHLDKGKTFTIVSGTGTLHYLIIEAQPAFKKVELSVEGLYKESGENLISPTSELCPGGRGITIMPEMNTYDPTNGKYYLRMRYSSGTDACQAAYLGQPLTLEEARASGLEDIKDKLFAPAGSSNTAYYFTDFSNDLVDFTFFDVQGVPYYLALRLTGRTKPIDTYFQITGVKGLRMYAVPSDSDNYFTHNKFQTVFLLQEDGNTPAADSTVTPTFEKMEGSKVFCRVDGKSELQTSGETAVNAGAGLAAQYTVSARDGSGSENYWITFLTQHTGGAKLYVNGANTAKEAEPREVFLENEANENKYHDILIANVGDAPLTDIHVKLEGTDVLELDNYWNVNDTDQHKTLAAFTRETMEKKQILSDNSVYAGNLAKIRLKKKGEGGIISGRLVISGTDAASGAEQIVTVPLTGIAGKARITTAEMLDGVKYVPYSTMFQTNDIHGLNRGIKFTFTEGMALPADLGLAMKDNGEVYGVPQYDSAAQLDGKFHFGITAHFSTASQIYGITDWESSAEFDLAILDNTNENVWRATDSAVEGTGIHAEVTIAIPNPDGTITVPEMNIAENSWANTQMAFKSEGEFSDFIDLWLDGARLTEGVDYTVRQGSVIATIYTKTLHKETGKHTLAMEFRVGGQKDSNSKLYRAAQNYEIGTAPIPDPKPDPEPDPTPDPKPDPEPDPEPDPTPNPDNSNGQTIITTPVTRPDDTAAPSAAELSREGWTIVKMMSPNGMTAPEYKHKEPDGTYSTGSRWIEGPDGTGHRYLFDESGILQTGYNTAANMKVTADGDVLMNGHLYYMNPDRDPRDPRTCYVMTNYLRIRPNYAGQTYYDIDGITFMGWMKKGENGLRYQTRILQPDKGIDLYLIIWRAQNLPACQHPDHPGDAAYNIPAGRYFFDDEGVLVQKETWNDGKDGKDYYTNANGMITQERAQ